MPLLHIRVIDTCAVCVKLLDTDRQSMWIILVTTFLQLFTDEQLFFVYIGDNSVWSTELMFVAMRLKRRGNMKKLFIASEKYYRQGNSI